MDQKPKRILHVIGVMNRGGAETMIMNLYRNIDRTMVQFDFVENSFEHAAFDEEILSLGGRIFRCPHYNGKNHFTYVNWWKNFFDEHGTAFTAVHGHLGSTAVIYLSIAKKHGLYTIAHSHNTNHMSLSGLLYQAYAYPTRYIADFFFGCSVEAGISRYGKKVCACADRFMVLNNAIDTELFAFREEVRSRMRRELDVDGKLVIGHVGRFAEQKNHKFLVQIFAAVHRRNPDAILLLVGDGPLRPEIEEQVRTAGVDSCVIFAGVQSNVCELYQAMDVMALPSLFEGKPFVIIEAQAAGLPCVISDKVPSECIITNKLVTIERLGQSPDSWAAHILQRVEEPRVNHTHEITDKGYDIHETAKWLQGFYLKIGDGCHAE